MQVATVGLPVVLMKLNYSLQTDVAKFTIRRIVSWQNSFCPEFGGLYKIGDIVHFSNNVKGTSLSDCDIAHENPSGGLICRQ